MAQAPATTFPLPLRYYAKLRLPSRTISRILEHADGDLDDEATNRRSAADDPTA